MDGYEAETSLELGTPAWSPVHMRLQAGMKKRWGERGGEVLEAAIARLGEDVLAERLEGSEELDALVVRAVNAAAATGSTDKRRLLAAVVKQAVLDDAKIDDASLVTQILEQVDAPHIRALEAIHRAEEEARASGDLGPTARGAEKELTGQVRTVANGYPSVVLRCLERQGLIEGSVSWDGVAYISGLTDVGVQLLASLKELPQADPAS